MHAGPIVGRARIFVCGALLGKATTHAGPTVGRARIFVCGGALLLTFRGGARFTVPHDWPPSENVNSFEEHRVIVQNENSDATVL
jgi:hypothetical protein